MTTTVNLALPKEQTPMARGSSFNALVDSLDAHGLSVDEGGAGVGWVRFAANANADDTLTINGRIYCFGPTGAAPPYHVAVAIGVGATNTIDNLVAAIHADLATRAHAAQGAGAVVCMIQSTNTGIPSNFALAEDTAGARLVLSAAVAVGGKARQNVARMRFGSYIVTAADVTALAVPAELPIATFPSTNAPQILMAHVLTTAGATVVMAATVVYVWRQFNAGFWTLCVRDGAATLTAADAISIIVVG